MDQIDPRTFPAPGSAVPGAPPPLRRALTPADGAIQVEARVFERAKGAVAVDDSAGAAPVAGVGLNTAAAMLGLAAGLEIAGLLSRRRCRKC